MKNMQHEDYLSLALDQARLRRGFCAPNPAVGAVVVKNQQILSYGTHWACGHPHAEVDALQKLGQEAIGASIYVTLEPCCHYGRTPPCTHLLHERGIAEVFYGMADVNPLVHGQGIQQLEKQGIRCHHLASQEIVEFYCSYHYWQRNKKPWVTIKLALTQDNQYAGDPRQRLFITGEACSQYTHGQRRQADALLTTINTILCDDPQLNVRLDEQIISKPIYLLDTHARLPLTARVLQTSAKLTVFHAQDADQNKISLLQEKGVNCIAVSSHSSGLDLPEIISVIGADGIHHLWMEVGGTCFQHVVKSQLANEVVIYRAPKCGMSHSKSLDLDLQHYRLVKQFHLSEDQVFIFNLPEGLL